MIRLLGRVFAVLLVVAGGCKGPADEELVWLPQPDPYIIP